MDLGVSGLASGFDWRSLVDQLSDVERLPQKRLSAEQSKIEERNNAYGSIVTQLKVLKSRVTALKSPDLYNARTTKVGDSAAATASASANSVQGTFNFQFTQLATSAKKLGQTNAGKRLSDSDDVSGVVLKDAGFSTAITAGTFRVNGAEVSIATTDTLDQVFQKISDATQGSVTASYSADTDRIQFSSSQPIVLGSATDTSNFLTAAKLYNNGTGSISSASDLGGIRLSSTLGTANLSGTLDFGATGTGKFKINGVEIEFTASDRIDTVLRRINDSNAGVTASYDTLNDRFLLENKKTGDIGIALEDVSGNFLAATKLSGGSLERGKDLLYSVNGGGQLRSHSNTIDEASSGLAGISVTALKEGGSTSITVSSDTSKVKEAITGFIDAYNKAQSLIASQTSSSTGADGKVSASVLASEGDAESIASTLRRLAYSRVEGAGLNLGHLESLGIVSNSDDDTLKLNDNAKLDDALANRMSQVRDLFTDSTRGIAAQLDSYLEKTAGEEGTLTSKQDLLTKQVSSIDVQISDLERLVQANRERMIASFVAMEEVQAKINQQLQFLNQRFGGS